MPKHHSGRARPSALEMLHSAVSVLATAPSLYDAARGFLREVSPRLSAHRAAVWQLREGERTARCIASWPPVAPTAGGQGLVWGQSEPAQGVSPPDHVGDEIPARSLLAAEGRPGRMLAAAASGFPGSVSIPLRFAGPVVGVVELWRPGSPIEVDERRALETASVCLAFWLRQDRARVPEAAPA